ncbi:MAG: sulfur carrier protein ThiS [Deltaproteobacteria bacterium]|nr:sulfur carrier protein ThiS [Deltaproteobacteria bacterium]
MRVRINGEEKDIEDKMTLGELLSVLNIKLQGVAVEVNREIVPKRNLSATPLKEGDSVEIVRMVGGG